MQTWSNNKINVQPWHLIPEEMSALGLTAADGTYQAWFYSTEQKLTGGAEAMNQAGKYIWWVRPFTFLYHLPGMPFLQKKLYRWIANNRHRMPGSTDACQIDLTKQDK